MRRRQPNRLKTVSFGRGGGDRKDKLPNKVCALYALQLPAPANRNKRNKAVKLSDFRGAGNLLLAIPVLPLCDAKLERKLSANSVQRLACPLTGLFRRASESQVTVASSVFAPEIRSAPRRSLTRVSFRSLITQHFFLFARAIRPQ